MWIFKFFGAPEEFEKRKIQYGKFDVSYVWMTQKIL